MNENDEKTIKALDEQLSKARKIIKKKSFICSMYLLKYIYDKNQDAYNNFLRIFNTLSTEEKAQVILNVSANLKEHGKTLVKR